MRRLLTVLIVILLLIAAVPTPTPVVAQGGLSYRQVAQIGRGAIDQLYWSMDGTQIAAVTTRGVWIYQANDLTIEPRLIEIPFTGLNSEPITDQEKRSSSYNFMPRVAFENYFRSMAVAPYTGGIDLYDVATGQRIKTFDIDKKRYTAVAVDPYRNTVAGGRIIPDDLQYGSPDHKTHIDIWDIETERLLRTVIVNFPQAHSMRYSPDGDYLAATRHYISDYAGEGGYLINVDTGELIFPTPENTTYVLEDATYTVPGLDMGGLVFANNAVMSTQEIGFAEDDVQPFTVRFVERFYPLNNIALSPNANRAAYFNLDKNIIEVQDIKTGEYLNLRAPLSSISGFSRAAFNSTGTHLAVYDANDGLLIVYAVYPADPESFDIFSRVEREWVGCAGRVDNCVTATTAHRLSLGLPVTQAELDYRLEKSVFYTSPDANWTLSYETDEATTFLIRNADGQKFRLIRPVPWNETTDAVGFYNVVDVLFSPDSRLLVMAHTYNTNGGYRDPDILIWRLDGTIPMLIKEMLPLPSRSSTLDVNTASGLVIAGTDEHGVYLWDYKTGKTVAILPHRESVKRVTFGDDTSTVITLSTDGLIRVWQAQ